LNSIELFAEYSGFFTIHFSLFANLNLMTIIITLPTFFEGEAEKIDALLRSGKADLIHVRKPSSTEKEMRTLLEGIPIDSRRKLVLHDHHNLAAEYGVYGVHLNGRNPEPPKGWEGSVSRSCHSFEEVKIWKNRCNYLSLSPIFNSISKAGYNSAFSFEEISKAKAEGIIDDKVYALGGVTFDKLEDVKRMGFGGAMILGDAWK